MNLIVGEKIKKLRKSRNLSQEEVADFINVSQSTYARIESGTSNSWAGYILPICQLFNIPPEELLKSENIVIHNNNTSCQYSGGYVINQISEKLIEQYEKRISEKEEYIKFLQKEIETLRLQIK
ncbi:MAG: helix-turn-helix transcriptional regulator [Capnocytophaga sp.]|nr:helix-turn-helix transcriptional regulator [Capnocytophaga sp.]